MSVEVTRLLAMLLGSWVLVIGPLPVSPSGRGCRSESEQKALCFSPSPTTPFLCGQEVMCFNAKLKILEHRQQRIAEVRAKYEWLMKELEATKQYLMLDPNKWLRECKSEGRALELSPLSQKPRCS